MAKDDDDLGGAGQGSAGLPADRPPDQAPAGSEPGMVSLFFGETGEQAPREGAGSAARFLRSLPLKKMLIWGAFLWLLYVLAPFFGLILVTFVLSYISHSMVQRAESLLKGHVSRPALVVAFYLLLLSLLGGFGWVTVPRVLDQGRSLLRSLQHVPAFPSEREHAAPNDPIDQDAEPPPDRSLRLPDWWLSRLSPLVGEERIQDWRRSWLTDELLAESNSLLRAAWSRVARGLQQVVRTAASAVAQLLVALLFSFLIVFDIPRLARSLQRLGQSRLAAAYHEVSPSIAAFARLLGQAFQAQTLIALSNTVLTAAGMAAIGIRPIGFLSVIVFLCSYIPVAGVFISTVPIGLIALKTGGPGKLLLVILMVTLVHVVEAYVLNPRIYALRMKLHPLAVLVILYVAEHLIGLWGLVIGVPLSVFVYRYLILGEEDTA